MGTVSVDLEHMPLLIADALVKRGKRLEAWQVNDLRSRYSRYEAAALSPLVADYLARLPQGLIKAGRGRPRGRPSRQPALVDLLAEYWIILVREQDIDKRAKANGERSATTSPPSERALDELKRRYRRLPSVGTLRNSLSRTRRNRMLRSRVLSTIKELIAAQQSSLPGPTSSTT